MKICIVRHGETNWNLEKKRQGRKDIPLNTTGIKQAYECSELLKNGNWEYIIASPLLRAQQTAIILAEKIGNIPILNDERLIERDFGRYEGTTYEEGLFLTELNESLEIESEIDVSTRMYNSFEDICKKYYPNDVIVVSHGSAIKILFKDMFMCQGNFHMKNGSLSLIEYDSNNYKLMYYNKSIDELSKVYH